MSATAERMTTAEVLRKALELLGPNGEHWCQGRYFDGDKACMQGATRVAAQELSQRTEAFLHIAKCTERLMEVLPTCEGNPIARWNDAPERTWRAPRLNSYELADKLRSSLLGSGPEGEER